MKQRPKILLLRTVRSTVHLCALVGVCLVPFDRWALGITLIGYLIGILGVTMGLHRYFSHRAFKTSRGMQLMLALLGTSTLQRGVLWWAAAHRVHHRHTDKKGDLHSPRDGLWHSHISWLDTPEVHQIDMKIVADLAKYPELRALERVYFLPALAWALACVGLGAGLSAAYPELGPRAMQFLCYGFFVRTVLIWHATFSVNSLAHTIGSRRFETADTSRNWLPLAIVTLGEGWHNNHHRFPTAARNGFYRSEVDLTYLALRGLAALGLIWDLRPVPMDVLDEGRSPAGG